MTGAFTVVMMVTATISTGTLPTRTASPPVAARLERVVPEIARRLALSRATPTPKPAGALASQLKRAEELSLAGALDDAATLLDALLKDGAARALALEAQDERALLSAHVQRASIAIARGEVGEARRLLARVLRWDATFSLSPAEGTPPLRATLGDVRRELGPSPTLERADLGDDARASVAVVARRIDATRYEALRFDEGQLVARIAFDDSVADAAIIDALARARARVSLRLEDSPRASQRHPRFVIAGAATLAVGVLLAATGIYFAAHAADQADNLNRGCGQGAPPCSAAELDARASSYDTSRISASVLLSFGAAALLGGGTTLALGLKWPR